MTRATIMATTRSRATGRTSDEGMQAELLEGAEDGGDMAVGVAAQAGEGGLGIDQGFAFESSADEIGEVGDVAEGFMLDLAVVAEGSAQEVVFLNWPTWTAPVLEGIETNITKAGETGNIYRLD